MTMREILNEVDNAVHALGIKQARHPERLNRINRSILAALAEADRLDAELAALKREKAGSVSIPLDQWRRLVELVQGVDATPHHESECKCGTCRDQREVDTIIAAVEVPHE